MNTRLFFIMLIVFNSLVLGQAETDVYNYTEMIRELKDTKQLFLEKKYPQSIAQAKNIKRKILSLPAKERGKRTYWYMKANTIQVKIATEKEDLIKIQEILNNSVTDYFNYFDEDNKSRPIMATGITNSLALLDEDISLLKQKLHIISKTSDLMPIDDTWLTNFFEQQISQVKHKIYKLDPDQYPNYRRKRRSIQDLYKAQQSYKANYGSTSLDGEIDEAFETALTASKTMFNLFGLSENTNLDSIDFKDIKINETIVDSLSMAHELSIEERKNFKQLIDAMEIPRRFDSILPQKILRETKKSIERLAASEQSNSDLYTIEKTNLLIANIFAGENKDSILNEFSSFQNEVNNNSFDDDYTYLNWIEWYLYFKNNDFEKALDSSEKLNINGQEGFYHHAKIASYFALKNYTELEKWCLKSFSYHKTISNEQEQYYLLNQIFYTKALLAQGRFNDLLNYYEGLKNNLKNKVSFDKDKNKLMEYALAEVGSFSAIANHKLGQFLSADELIKSHFLNLYDAEWNINLVEFNTELPLLYNQNANQKSELHQSLSLGFNYLSQRGINSDDLVGLGYNNILKYKEFQISSQQRILDNILKAEDYHLKRLYDEWIDTQEKKTDINYLDRDSISDYSAYYRKLLLKEIATKDKSPQIDWKIVRGNLNDSEVAIEFISYHPYFFESTADEVHYGAFVLSKESEHPIFVKLCKESDIDEVLNSNIGLDENEFFQDLYVNKSNRLYRLIWEPLNEYIENAKKVYYSPIGTLHNIAFSALKTNDTNSYLLDKHELVQVSSTRKIKSDTNKSNFKTALLFGNLNYDCNHCGNSKKDEVADTRGGRWTHLLGTKEEIDLLQNILLKKGIKTSVKVQKSGTEEKFYDEIKNQPDILHIATHAFFEKPISNSVLEPTDLIGLSKIMEEKNPMNWSGLVMSGANTYWETGKKIDANTEDGIITSNELASLDLRNVRLVVLSACETALGNSLDNEGVYGLQRGLKLAGAKNLLLSLWKIEDQRTAKYMSVFYNHLITKNELIDDAFLKTQREIKKEYPNPYYWASFILIH